MKAQDQRNAINNSTTFGVTKFSDYTADEFAVLRGFKRSTVPRKFNADVKKPKKAVSSPKDIVSKNWADVDPPVVSSVKNQGQCGTCWAFSAAEEVESMWAMAGNPLYEFSPQQIASCTTACAGCGGTTLSIQILH